MGQVYYRKSGVMPSAVTGCFLLATRENGVLVTHKISWPVMGKLEGIFKRLVWR
jgi:hypothetical protein